MGDISLETIHEILVRVEDKVNKTNGRVKSLEIWRSFLAGAWTISIVLVGIYLKYG